MEQSEGLLRTMLASQVAREPVEAVYIHIPFCLKKCNYCDFLSFARPAEMERYVQLLLQEMTAAKQRYRIEPKSIFIGGGTPTCLPEKLSSSVYWDVSIALPRHRKRCRWPKRRALTI